MPSPTRGPPTYRELSTHTRSQVNVILEQSSAGNALAQCIALVCKDIQHNKRSLALAQPSTQRTVQSHHESSRQQHHHQHRGPFLAYSGYGRHY